MFTSIASFEASWLSETQRTQRILDTLTDASLNQRITSDNRSLGQIGWHLAATIHEMLSRTGLDFPASCEEELAPASAVLIAKAYKESSKAMLAAVKQQWTDETLFQTTDMYGEEWPNGLTLRVLIMHEAHHRGQMTVLMRQAGLRVPEVYGPTREDWIERGMTPLV